MSNVSYSRYAIVAGCLMAVTALASCRPETNMDALKHDLEAVLAKYPDAEVGISVRDASQDLALDIDGDLEFHAASTMKVAVMIELFRQAEAGRFDLDDSLRITNQFTSIFDGSEYAIDEDSDAEIYSMIGDNMSIRDLMYRLITSSSNLATNILIGLVSADSVQATIEKMGTRHMRVLRGVQDLKAFDAGMNNTTTSSDLALLMEAIRDGGAVSADASAEMRRILKDVPVYLVIGKTPEDPVAHKTGSITGHHHDAGIVYPHAAEPYVLTILTRGITDEQMATGLGREISEVVYRHLRGSAGAE